MSFLKKLFGGGSSSGAAPAAPKRQLEYNGFMIAATPYKEGGQWQTCGTVTKTVNGEVKQLASSAPIASPMKRLPRTMPSSRASRSSTSWANGSFPDQAST